MELFPQLAVAVAVAVALVVDALVVGARVAKPAPRLAQRTVFAAELADVLDDRMISNLPCNRWDRCIGALSR